MSIKESDDAIQSVLQVYGHRLDHFSSTAAQAAEHFATFMAEVDQTRHASELWCIIMCMAAVEPDVTCCKDHSGQEDIRSPSDHSDAMPTATRPTALTISSTVYQSLEGGVLYCRAIHTRLRTMNTTSIILRSTSGEDLPVQAHLLKAGSKIFRDMLELHDGSNEPIPLDYDSNTIRRLITFLDFENPLDDVDLLSDPVTLDLIRLASQFDIQLIAERISLRLHRIKTLPPGSVWAIFTFASQLHDVALAVKAIRAMANETWLWNGQWDSKKVRDVDVRYSTALFRACFKESNDVHWKNGQQKVATPAHIYPINTPTPNTTSALTSSAAAAVAERFSKFLESD